MWCCSLDIDEPRLDHAYRVVTGDRNARALLGKCGRCVAILGRQTEHARYACTDINIVSMAAAIVAAIYTSQILWVRHCVGYVDKTSAED